MNVLKYGIGVLALMACGRSTEDRAESHRIETRLAHLDTMVQAIGTYRDPGNEYLLVDTDRDRKPIGALYTRRTISTGDRIFLGDDIWDVKFLKVFADRADTTGPSRIHYVELMVKFVTKATDSKPRS